MLNAGIGEGQSTVRPPFFDGTNYSYWKERMRIFVQSNNFKIWLAIKNGDSLPMKKVGDTLIPKDEDEYDEADFKKAQLNATAINFLYCAVNANDYQKISRCQTANQMWNKLMITYEGTPQVRESKIDLLTHEYELFAMKENELVEDMFGRFSNIVNDLDMLGKTLTDKELVRKIMRSLTKEWESKVNSIYEGRDYNVITYDGLRGNLITYETNHLSHTFDVKKRTGIAFKASSSQNVEIDDSDSYIDSDNDSSTSCDILVECFNEFLKHELNKSKKKNTPSVDESIQPSIVSHSIAYELWNDLKKRYSCSNGPRVYQLKSELNSLRQKGQSVVSYYNQFITLWNQLYGSSDLTGGFWFESAGVMRARFDRDKTVDFLLGLDDEQFGNIRSQIIGTEPVPDLDRVYFLVTQEERHRHIVRTRDDRTDSVAFAARSDKRPLVPNRSCSHCGRTNHSVDTCFELISFPAQYARGGGRGRDTGPPGRGGSASGGRGSTRHGNAPHTPAGSGQPVQGNSGGPPAAVHASVSDSSGNLSDQMSRLMSMLEASASHAYTGHKTGKCAFVISFGTK
ncbi:unnamed protein product [Cuscuta campestris]|uniref:Retrotransposon gag domain-containing protein n=1 Tax=Cuscuta campestris TaxID=132261 RepID=A0A484LBD7_9ASTE|nr:unnamed protein product [Cuscuta campestris]